MTDQVSAVYSIFFVVIDPNLLLCAEQMVIASIGFEVFG
jgi:hypothetical protein